MQITAAQLAALVNATVEGDPNVVITGPGKIEDSAPGQITFLGNQAYENYLYSTKASAVLVTRDFQPKQTVATTLLRVDDVYSTVSRLLELVQQQSADTRKAGISPQAYVAESASVADGVYVGHFTVVAEGASVGAGTILHDQVQVGVGAKIGADCILYPGVRVLDGCVIGDRCVLNANSVIGGDGFGFAPDPATGRYAKIPQVGNVILEDDVEVGACTTIDRASMGSTIIRRGVKLDNHIQVAHNVEIESDTVIAALTGIAGSVKIGPNCRIGGQVGFAGHSKIAAGTSIQAQTGVISDITKPNQVIAGAPHRPHGLWIRSAVEVKNLPQTISKLKARIEELERKLAD